MSAKLEISTERTPADLRSWARSCGNGRAAARAYAIANALEGMTRAEAARLAGMERQALRDAVIRYNAEGVAGLFDRPKGHRREWLTQAEQAILADTVYRGPRPEINGVCTWTCEALAIWISERFGKTIHPDSVGRLLRRMGLSRQKARSVHPKKDPKAQEHFQKRGLRNALKTAAEAHPGKQIRLFFQDEARIGQKGRLCHRWWTKGQRPPGMCDQRFDWTYLFAAADPVSGEAFALVLPTVSIKVMNVFLADFSKTLGEHEHALMVLDGAGWHRGGSLTVPDNITLIRQPPYAPECNPVERIWLFLRERLLSLQVWPDQETIIQACCNAWNALASEPGRIQSLCLQPWDKKVIS